MEPVRPGKGKGSQTKDEEAPKKDESEKKPPNWQSLLTDERKKTAEEQIPKNRWNQFQRRLKGSGLGGEKKILAALYREEQRALRTREEKEAEKNAEEEKEVGPS